jgi:hypothetical protein
MALGRFLYFLGHPSEYIELWTFDVTVFFSLVTLLVILRQLSLMTGQSRLMRHQDDLMQRQTEILVRQDELLSRRARLRMYKDHSRPEQIVICCRNDGNKTAQNFYWHLSIPLTVGGGDVWDGLGNQVQRSVSVVSHEGVEYRHYTGLFHDPLYPTRDTPVVLIVTKDPNISLWWSTISEDGADPTPDSKMQRMEREEPLQGKHYTNGK